MTKQEMLEWCAAFMFLSFERDGRWYEYCSTKHFELYDTDLQSAMFWWSLRSVADEHPWDWVEWRRYLAWKYQQMKIVADVNTEVLR